MTDYTYSTGNPIGSTDVRDGVDNLKSFDILLNSTDDAYQDRLGNTVPTAAGAIKRIGPVVTAWTFTTGGTLNYPNEAALNPVDGNYYGWTGTFPKVVAPGTDPTAVTGYVPRTDVALRDELADDDGANLLGYKTSTVYDALERKIYTDDFKLSADPDHTGAIQRGIQHCIDNSLSTLYFKSGIYLVSDALGNCPVNFVSDGKTIIRSTNTATLGSANGKSIIVFAQGITIIKGIVFDGQVSATANTYNQDPASWNSSNYETWYGFQGPLVSAASGFSIIDSDAVNFYRAGYYITGCSDFMVVRPKTKRNRGNFGDGIFIGNGCHNFTVIGSSARDFTRGGLVCDMGCYDFTILGNSATYGHDWSALYGGTEYAAGMWLEKSTRGTASGSRLTDCGYFGAIMSLEIEGFMPVPYREYLTLSFGGARVDGGVVGVNCTSADGSIGKISITNVDSSVQSGKTAMLLRGHAGIVVDVVGGSATVSGATAGACIAVGALGQSGRAPIYNLTSVGVGHTTQSAAADVKSKIAIQYVGDVCLYSIAEYDFELNINDVYSLSDSKEILVGIVAARLTPSYHYPLITLNSPRHQVYYIDSSADAKTSIKANDTSFSRLKTTCLWFEFNNCVMKGVAEIYFNSTWEFTNNVARNTSFMAGQNKIHYVGAAPAYTLTPAFMLDSCRFSGDLSSADSYLVDIRRVDTTGARVGWIHRDVIYTNYGGNGTNSAAISCRLGDYNLSAYKYSNAFDTLVANVLRTSAGVVTDPATVNLGVRENFVLAG